MSGVDKMIERLCPSGVPFSRVGDIAQVGTGSSDRKDAVESGEYPFYVRSQTVMRIESYEFDEEAILIPGEGKIGEIFHYVDGKYALHQRAYRIHFLDDRISVKFAFHYFSANFKRFILQKAVNSTVTSIRKPMITDFRLPVPPIEVQEEIVGILDDMASLKADLESALISELELRARQYAHHRDLLLSFDGDSVPRLPMGEVGRFTRGRRFTKNDVVPEGIAAIHYGEIYTQYRVATTSTISHVREDMRGQLRFAQPGDVVFAAVGETVEDVAKPVAWLGDEPVAIHDDTFSFRSELNPTYVSYFAQTADFHRQKDKYVARAKVKRLSRESLAKILIPVPSAQAQQDVVDVLDRFDALTSDLTIELPAEISARREQYEHYRDRLLSFEEVIA